MSHPPTTLGDVISMGSAEHSDLGGRSERSERKEQLLTALFATTSLFSAALIFMLEPMVAKLVLPLFGGSASVWNVCVVFFQIALLIGYAYAHWSWRLLHGKQRLFHIPLLLLPLLTLPLALPGWAAPPVDADPSLWLILVLVATAGASFLALSATGPLLQAWFASTAHARAKNPYFLYATSNAGSLIGLLIYPLIVEPSLSLSQQRTWWSLGYGFVVVLIVACACVTRSKVATGTNEIDERNSVTNSQRLRWMFLAAVPASLMLGVTTYVATDIASFPLLWVIPLSLYLLTFVVAFAKPSSAEQQRIGPGVLGLIIATVVTAGVYRGSHQIASSISQIAVFAFVALVVHRSLAAARPTADKLTEFYLWISIGGVVGGLFNTFVAPMIFDVAIEYYLVLALAIVWLLPRRADLQPVHSLERYALSVGPALLVLALHWPGRFEANVVIIALIVLGVIALSYWRPRVIAVMVALTLTTVCLSDVSHSGTARSFYGVYQVTRYDDRVVLRHGSTLHGNQLTDPQLESEPTTYYTRSGPFGDVVQTMRAAAVPTSTAAGGEGERWAMIGLGTGTSLAYGKAGDRVMVYEIDQLDVDIASNPQLFTYMRDTKADVETKVGDGRLEIAKAPDHIYKLIVIDAFSSDSIPTHLLTEQAFEIYRSKLAPGGVIAVHISNRNIDLSPVLKGISQTLAMAALERTDAKASDKRVLQTPSRWVAVANEEATLDPLRNVDGWKPVGGRAVEWTDDYSNIVRLIH